MERGQVLVRWTRDGGETFVPLVHPAFTTIRAAKAWSKTGEATQQLGADGEVVVLTVEAATRPRFVPVVDWGNDEPAPTRAEDGGA